MKLKRVVADASPAQSLSGRLDDPDGALLDGLGDLSGERVLVVGPDIGIMCGLIRRGCTEVTELDPSDRPEAGSVGLAIVPCLTGEASVAPVLAHARRSVRPLGRVLVRTAPGPSDRLCAAIRRILEQNGFTAVRDRRVRDRAVFTAELPAFGPLRRMEQVQ